MFKRLDQFDYEILGVEDRWYINKTAQMLTSFEMETKGYFDRNDVEIVFKKLYAKNETYVMNIIKSCTYEINTPPDPWTESHFPQDSILIDSTTTTFPRTEFLKDMGKNNDLIIDLDKLKRYLSGEEAPSIPLIVSIPTHPIDADNSSDRPNTENDQKGSSDCSERNTIAESQYLFKCKNHYWDIVYDCKQTLVSDNLGMRYVAYLIMHKHKLIDWTDLYNSVKGVDPDSVKKPGSQVEDLSNGFDMSGGKIGRIYAGKDKKALQLEMVRLKDKQDEAKEFGHDDIVDTLQDEIDDIKKYIMDTYRPDGTLKENASDLDKKVNGIKAAIKRAIADIEKGIPELGRHLTDSIVQKWQRSSPSYLPSIDIEWKI